MEMEEEYWTDYGEVKDVYEVKETDKKIRVIGIGGGGGNTVNSLYDKLNKHELKIPSESIEFSVINSDSQDLAKSPIPDKIQIAEDGQGAGSDPELGKKFATENSKRIKDSLKNAYLIFITAGMGGGTGTGAAPVVARLAREENPNALVVGVVTTPFSSDRNIQKTDLANSGIEAMKKEVNALIIVSNDSIMEVFKKKGDECIPAIDCKKAFRATDTVLINAITGIVGIIKNVGSQNADFRDIYNIMKNAGTDVIIGVGSATGPEKYKNALDDALNSPLLCGRTIDGAKGIIVNFCTAVDKSDINGVNYVRNTIYGMADPKANYKDCITEDPNLKDSLILTVIATDFVDERGELVTHMMRVAEAHGIKTSRSRKNFFKKENEEKKKKDLFQEIILPNFEEPTFMRMKRSSHNADNT
ncbi:MAG: cell division FtsZ family protein [Elusimicrobiales bacterium]|nr:cell division FtsZ family protein [Elusimicrobiales bacterium]